MADTFWLLVVLATLVFVAVAAVFLVALRRRRSEDEPEPQLTETGDDGHLVRRFVIGGGIVLPGVLLAALLVVNLATVGAEADSGPLAVTVTGHQYWWEIEQDGVRTANELVIPVGTPVELTLRSEDVIHSFWVPELGGKVDMVPGRDNQLVIEADEPGRYVGRCAEFCGLQHAWMLFEVVALAPDDYERRRANEAADATEPTDPDAIRGREVFLGQSCVGCHAIRGVAEEGVIGPDLTHLAVREDIGAGVLPNTAEELAGFIENPQDAKPGALMPPQDLTDDELDALVDYLGGLG